MNTSSVSTPKNARSTKDYDDGDLTGPNFVDHFSLREPSTTVKFRGARVHVYETYNEQILLEDRKSSRDTLGDPAEEDVGNRRQHRHNITVKRMPWGSFGLTALRAAYAIVATLLFSYAFALSFQIILFLFVKLAVEGRSVNEEQKLDKDEPDGEIAVLTLELLSTILSTPVFLYGFSSFMAMATTFVSEAWEGGHLIRLVIGLPTVLKELLYFICFILVPIVTFFAGMFLRVESPWEYACYAWICSTVFLFCIFAFAVFWCEVTSCFRLMSVYYRDDCQENTSKFGRFCSYIRRSILLVQMQKYGGKKAEQYLVGADDVAPEGGYTFSEDHQLTIMKMSLYTRITLLKCFGCMFETLDPPKRVYSMEEVRDVLPFVTSNMWSLEALFCTSKKQRKIIAAKGPAALTRSQIVSSAVCNIVGTLLIILFVIGLLFWLQTGVVSYIFVGVLCFFCCLLPLARSNMAVVAMYTDINKAEKTVDEEMVEKNEDGDDEDETTEVGEETTMFQVWESSRVSQPKPWVCYTGVAMEFMFLFVWPCTTLFTVGNWPIGILFIVLAVFSFLRRYFDASAILCELGSLSRCNIEKYPGKERKYTPKVFSQQEKVNTVDTTLIRKARLSDIVGYVSKSDSVTRWMWFFGGLVTFTCFLYSSAVSSGDGLGERPPIITVNDFEYIPEESLQYPSCQMSKGFRISVNGTERDTPLADYAFLSALAYETTDVTSYLLPQWFGAEGVAVDEDTLVKEYRAEAGNTNTPVFFKFFTFPDAPDAGLISIRGSQTSWDWMVNMQLWSASGLAQLVKWGTPYGWIWTPILDDLVRFIGLIQTEDLEKVSYYKVTTEFANDMKDQFKNLFVTGASLGGGLAIITGAQAKIGAVAISGLGAEYARDTLTPPVTVDDLNKYVYNFLPDRDYIARIGGRMRQSQEAQCSASASNLFGCHSMWRSVCEINYRCGTNGRPVICRCHYRFGYPEPVPIGNTTRSFAEACREEEEAFLAGTGSTIRSGFDYDGSEL